MPKHKHSTKTELYYKRTKEGVEIRGDPTDVKKLIWFDMIGTWLSKAVPVIAVLKIPFQLWLSAAWRYIKNLW